MLSYEPHINKQLNDQDHKAGVLETSLCYKTPKRNC